MVVDDLGINIALRFVTCRFKSQISSRGSAGRYAGDELGDGAVHGRILGEVGQNGRILYAKLASSPRLISVSSYAKDSD